MGRGTGATARGVTSLRYDAPRYCVLAPRCGGGLPVRSRRRVVWGARAASLAWGGAVLVRRAGDAPDRRRIEQWRRYCATRSAFIYSREAPIACVRGYGVASSRKEFLHNAAQLATSPSLVQRFIPALSRGQLDSPLDSRQQLHSLATAVGRARGAASYVHRATSLIASPTLASPLTSRRVANQSEWQA